MRFYTSSVGKKAVMAITGFIGFSYVLLHLIGNLQVFAGPDTINNYAAFLKSRVAVLWVFRAVLLISVVLHIVAATQLTLQSWFARPVRYLVFRYQATTYAARTMRRSGPIIALFIVYHLLHLTTGQLHPRPMGFTTQAGEHINVYNNVVYGFQIWWTSAVYIIAILAIALHLYHGVWSLLQSLGINHPKYNLWRRIGAILFAIFIAGAGVSIPVAVLIDFLRPV